MTLRTWVGAFSYCASLTGIVLIAAVSPAASAAPEVRTSPLAGAPRPWEAGLVVSPYTTVNLLNGNALTVLPLLHWDPLGPPLRFALYHNSSIADAGPNSGLEAGWGFDLGPGWRVTYGGSVAYKDEIEATVYDDDGNPWVYAWDSGDFLNPVGKHDTLVRNIDDTWALTSPGQFIRHYDASGLLIEEIDSSGNVLTIGRESYGNYERFLCIESAAPGDPSPVAIDFVYDGAQLIRIDGVEGREWDFAYDGSDRLDEVLDPRDNETLFDYEAGGDKIETVTDATAATWTYAYNADDRLDGVTDPASCEHEMSIEYVEEPVSDLWETIVTDRRGEEWTYHFDSDDLYVKRTDPLLNTIELAYDADLNVASYTNELENTWTATYGDVGNLETLTTPLDSNPEQTWTLTWEQEFPATRPNFWRLTQVTDPNDNWTKYEYGINYGVADDSLLNGLDDPTLVVRVIECDPVDAEEGEDTSTTTNAYWGPDDEDDGKNGQVKLVTDANGVEYFFDYDTRGYAAGTREGPVGALPGYYPCEGTRENNAAGQPTAGTDDGQGCMVVTHDAFGNTVADDCICPIAAPTPPVRVVDPDLIVSPSREFQTTCMSGNVYDELNRPTAINRCILGGNARVYEATYDALRRATSTTITTDEPGGSADLERAFAYTEYDQEGRLLTRTGPDGQETAYTYDALGRLWTVDRGDMSAIYTYDDAGRLETVTYGNAATTVYTYDEVDRVETITHEDGNSDPLFTIAYTWTLDNNVSYRIETDYVAEKVFETGFAYDNRDRLIQEDRDVQPFGAGQTKVYTIDYTYDQLGNRLSKTNGAADTRTEYFYDVPNDGHYAEPPEEYTTRNNRLTRYEEYDITVPESPVLTRTVWYVYYKTGNAANIIVKDEYVGSGTESDYDWYRSLAFYYTTSGQVWQVLWDRWKADAEWTPVAGELPPVSEEIGDYETLAAREFRYDSPRARYLSRPLRVDAGHEFEPDALATWEWTDYDGVEPYGDFTVHLDGEDVPQPTNVTRFFAGSTAQQTIDGGAIQYHHGDLIRSTMATTDTVGDAAATTAYTAFGERIPGATTEPWDDCETRYAYAGGWGYESGLLTLAGAPGTADITLQHLGARWYQPGIGRFVQRDPIGLVGGRNVYVFSGNAPPSRVDPSGTDFRLVHGNWAHQTLYIQDPSSSSGWTEIHYFRKAGIGCAGAGDVWVIPSPDGRPAGTRQNPSSPEEDRLMKAIAARYQAAPPYFCIPFSSCCSFNEQVIREAGIPMSRYIRHVKYPCFISDTLVLTVAGVCEIAEIATGQQVVSMNSSTKATSTGTVTGVHTAYVTEVVELDLDDETITSTPYHPFWLIGRGWVRADEIRAGDALLSQGGTAATVYAQRYRRLLQPVRVFNLSVDGNRTYFVGTSQVLVHNK